MMSATSRGRRAVLLSAGLLLALAAPARADYHDALTAYERGDFAAAAPELEPLAAAGDPRAQLLLGRMSAAGQGVLQDYVRAHLLFNLAAAAGDPAAAAARDELAGRMTAEQIAEAQRQAAAWSPVPAAVPDAGVAPPIDVSADPAAQMLEGQAVTDLQWQLALHGYDPGPADGKAGPRTIAAIRHYQADAGLPVDGRPTGAVLDHLQFTVPAVRNAAAVTTAPPRPAAASAPAVPGPLDTMDTGLRRIYVAGIQEALRARGYDPGLVDGVAGPRTRAAIRRYQAAAGLPADGQPSPALLNHLKYVGGQVAAR